RRGVHVGVAQPAGGEAVDVRRADRATVGAELPEPGVVEDDEQHVRRALTGPQRLRPRGRRDVEPAPDDTRERATRLVVNQGHCLPPCWPCAGGVRSRRRPQTIEGLTSLTPNSGPAQVARRTAGRLWAPAAGDGAGREGVSGLFPMAPPAPYPRL